MGWADVKEEISIDTSWLNEPCIAETNKERKWKVEVQTANSKVPKTIKTSSKESDILLSDILSREVWVCSGQSNMEHPVGGKTGQSIYKQLPHPKNLRLFTVDRREKYSKSIL